MIRCPPAIGVRPPPAGSRFDRQAVSADGRVMRVHARGRPLGPAACGIEARTVFEPEFLRLDPGLRRLFGAMVGDRYAGRCRRQHRWPHLGLRGRGSPAGTRRLRRPGTGLHSYVVVRDDPAGKMFVEVLSDGASDLWLALPDDG